MFNKWSHFLKVTFIREISNLKTDRIGVYELSTNIAHRCIQLYYITYIVIITKNLLVNLPSSLISSGNYVFVKGLTGNNYKYD